jgi:hypothetical protein
MSGALAAASLARAAPAADTASQPAVGEQLGGTLIRLQPYQLLHSIVLGRANPHPPHPHTQTPTLTHECASGLQLAMVPVTAPAEEAEACLLK